MCNNLFSQPADCKNRQELYKQLLNSYHFLTRMVIGYSHCRRPITAFSLGDTYEMVLISGAFHGMEWLTSLLILRFMHTVCESVKTRTPVKGINLEKFLGRRGVVFVPCVNPDGVEIQIHGPKAALQYEEMVRHISDGDTSRWQANACGVDINHNFNAGWKELKALEIKSGITSPAITRYGGRCPESEPETIAMTEFCRKNNFRHATAFHSQGEEIYWQYGENTPERSRLMAMVMEQVSGYKMAAPEGLAVGGGFKDWFICELCKPGFTVEIGKGVNPLPISDLDDIYNQLEEMMTCLLIM